MLAKLEFKSIIMYMSDQQSGVTGQFEAGELEDMLLLDRLATDSEYRHMSTGQTERQALKREARQQRVYTELWDTIIGLRRDAAKPRTVIHALLVDAQPLSIHQLSYRTQQEVADIEAKVADLSMARLVVRSPYEENVDRVALLVVPEL